jgi:hypothetical protein
MMFIVARGDRYHVALIRLMSFVGGIAASGAAKKYWGEPDRPEGAKEKIRQQIAKARGELDKYFQEKRRFLCTALSKSLKVLKISGLNGGLLVYRTPDLRVSPWIPGGGPIVLRISHSILRG